MSQYAALEAMVFLIGFVVLFERIHERNRLYRQLSTLYHAVMAGSASC